MTTTNTTTTTITAQQLYAYAAGEVEITDLIGIEPDYIEQLRGRAQFFLDGGHDARALIMLEMLEELDRSDPLPSLLAIEILLRRGESDAAEEKIQSLHERHPDDPNVAIAEAELLIQTGQMVPAAELLKRVIDADPKASTDAGKRAQAVAARAHRMLANG